MDQHPFDADPDPNFHVDVDSDPVPDWHQNDADLMRILTQLSHMLENALFLLLVTALQVNNVLPVSSVSNFKYLIQLIEILWKKYCGIDTDPDRPDPDPQH